MMRTMLVTTGGLLTLLMGCSEGPTYVSAAPYPQPYGYGEPVSQVPISHPPTYYQAAPAAVAQPPMAAPRLTSEQLDQLLAPIALYPDPLLAQLLPACVYPQEVATAMAWLRVNPQPDEYAINQQPWEASIKAMVHYPTALQTLADHLDWTQAVGAAFVNQPDDVSASIQRLRAIAQANGALTSTPQQTVVVDNGVIEVLPPTPQVMYVPVYNPQVVYAAQPVGYPAISFTAGFAIGNWLSNDYDWHDRCILVGTGWHPEWRWEGRRWQRDERWEAQRRHWEDRRRTEGPSAPPPAPIWRPDPRKPTPTLPAALAPRGAPIQHPGLATPAPKPSPTAKPFSLPAPQHAATPAPTPRPTPNAFMGRPERNPTEPGRTGPTNPTTPHLVPTPTPRPTPMVTPATPRRTPTVTPATPRPTVTPMTPRPAPTATPAPAAPRPTVTPTTPRPVPTPAPAPAAPRFTPPVAPTTPHVTPTPTPTPRPAPAAAPAAPRPVPSAAPAPVAPRPLPSAAPAPAAPPRPVPAATPPAFRPGATPTTPTVHPTPPVHTPAPTAAPTVAPARPAGPPPTAPGRAEEPQGRREREPGRP